MGWQSTCLPTRRVVRCAALECTARIDVGARLIRHEENGHLRWPLLDRRVRVAAHCIPPAAVDASMTARPLCRRARVLLSRSPVPGAA